MQKGGVNENWTSKGRGWKNIGRGWTRRVRVLEIGYFSWTSYMYDPLHVNFLLVKDSQSRIFERNLKSSSVTDSRLIWLISRVAHYVYSI